MEQEKWVAREVDELVKDYALYEDIQGEVEPTVYLEDYFNAHTMPPRVVCEEFLAEFMEPSAASLWLSKFNWENAQTVEELMAIEEEYKLRDVFYGRLTEMVFDMIPEWDVADWLDEFAERCRDGMVQETGDIFAQMATAIMEVRKRRK